MVEQVISREKVLHSRGISLPEISHSFGKSFLFKEKSIKPNQNRSNQKTKTRSNQNQNRDLAFSGDGGLASFHLLLDLPSPLELEGVSSDLELICQTIKCLKATVGGGERNGTVQWTFRKTKCKKNFKLPFKCFPRSMVVSRQYNRQLKLKCSPLTTVDNSKIYSDFNGWKCIG